MGDIFDVQHIISEQNGIIFNIVYNCYEIKEKIENFVFKKKEFQKITRYCSPLMM